MRAMIFDEFGAAPVVSAVADPVPEPDGVVLQVGATGLCRSDWHGWMGHDSDVRLPHVPGHEIAGVVVAVGTGVHVWKTGARVTVPFVCACGRCRECQLGQQQVCSDQRQPGFTEWGSFAELVAIPRADLNLVALPTDMPMTAGASLGCRFGTAFHAVFAQGRVSAGETVVVHGCGGLGLATVMVAAAAGARVIAVDIDVRALTLAKQVGAADTVSGLQPDIGAAVAELSAGGADVSFDCVGSEQTAANSLRSLATRGRHVQVGLLPSAVGMPRLPMDRVIARELQVLGSHGVAASEYPRMLAMIERRHLDPAQLLGPIITLDEAPRALTTMGKGAAVGITVIEPA